MGTRADTLSKKSRCERIQVRGKETWGVKKGLYFQDKRDLRIKFKCG